MFKKLIIVAGLMVLTFLLYSNFQGEVKSFISDEAFRVVRQPQIKIDPTIVRGYDIRGFVEDVKNPDGTVTKANLTPEVAELVGKALGSRLSVDSTVVVSGDHRSSTRGLIDLLIKGYTSCGINVEVDYSSIPTGGNNWYLITHQLNGAVQVTGSHNPAEFNGMKISEGLKISRIKGYYWYLMILEVVTVKINDKFMMSVSILNAKSEGEEIII